MSLPVVHLAGSPYEQGRRHGEALRGRIAHNLGVYFERFERETKLSREEVLRRARLYREAIAGQNAGYHDGMRGLAEGSSFGLDEIAALNVRYEILYYQFGAIAMEEAAAGKAVTIAEPDGCTAFAVLPEPKRMYPTPWMGHSQDPVFAKATSEFILGLGKMP
jgi:isopenicillin-N N-acyltransferase-like protein